MAFVNNSLSIFYKNVTEKIILWTCLFRVCESGMRRFWVLPVRGAGTNEFFDLTSRFIVILKPVALAGVPEG